MAEFVKAGHRVIFVQAWCYVQDKVIGWCDTIDQLDDSFELVTWVKVAPIDNGKCGSNGNAQGSQGQDR